MIKGHTTWNDNGLERSTSVAVEACPISAIGRKMIPLYCRRTRRVRASSLALSGPGWPLESHTYQPMDAAESAGKFVDDLIHDAYKMITSTTLTAWIPPGLISDGIGCTEQCQSNGSTANRSSSLYVRQTAA